jgi:16S rRNA (cytosine967-C5)-methyltransferase
LSNDPTREAAFALLTTVFEQRRTLEDALNALPAMDPRDRSAAHRVAAAVLRRTGTLDAVLEPFLRKAPPDPVRHVLRIGAAGLLFLAMPAHAAVGTAVALARTLGLAPFAGLVNAVLRKVAVAGTPVLETLDSPRLDTPAWLWASWGKNARAIAEAHQHEAPLDLTRGPRATTLPASGLILPTGSLRFPVGTHVNDVPGFADGTLWVQDAAAALPVILLAPRPGERVADLCAAPGGKAAQLAASGAHVTAVEKDPARLERLASNLRRCQLTADLVHADVLDWTPPELFDAVLLDAPCSATGTIRRHPDVPHLKRARDISLLARSQDRLLAAAARLLRPGGRLIYAVCSLQPEEGAERLAGSGLATEPFQPDELPGLSEAISTDGFLRTYPHMWSHIGGMDGFFAARLTRH